MKILIAERDPLEQKGIQWMIISNQIPHELIHVSNTAEDSINALLTIKPNLFIFELEMFDQQQKKKLVKLLNQNKETRVIVHTNQKTYHSAYEALQIKAEDLFVKPILSEEWLRKIKQIVREDRSHQIQSNDIPEAYKLFDLLFGQNECNLKDITPTEDLPDVVVVVSPDEENRINRGRNIGLKNEWALIIEEMSEYQPNIAALDDHFVLLFKTSTLPKEIHPIMSLEKIWLRFCNRIKYEGSFSFSVGIGNIYKDIRFLHQSYSEAKLALNRRFYFGGNQVFSPNQAYFTYPSDPFLTQSESQKLTKCLYTCDRASIKHFLDEKFNCFPNTDGKYPDPDILRIRLTSVLAHIRRFMLDKNYLNQVEERYISLFQHILNGETLFSIVQRILYFCYLLCDVVEREEKSYDSLIVAKAKEFIDQNYRNSISLQEIAKKVNRHPHYFSHVFKKEMGQTYSDYLLQKRVNEAQYLIKNTNSSIADIARKVGYQDQNYFSRVFKRKSGLSPLKWKTENSTK